MTRLPMAANASRPTSMEASSPRLQIGQGFVPIAVAGHHFAQARARAQCEAAGTVRQAITQCVGHPVCPGIEFVRPFAAITFGRQPGQGEDPSEILVGALLGRAGDQRGADGRVVDHVGQGHLRAGDLQAMLGQDGLPFGRSQKVAAADGEVADAGLHTMERLGLTRALFGRAKELEEPGRSAPSARRLEADHRQPVIGRIAVPRLAPLALRSRLPGGSQQAFCDLAGGGHGTRMRREHAVDILGADAALPVASEEVIAGRQAADDDHVLPAVGRECGRDLGHHGIGRQGLRQWSQGLQALFIDSMWRAISDASRV
jgi:hypothetical protein